MEPLDKQEPEYSILVVDDEIDNVKLLKRTLRKAYNVVGFTSPFEALEYLQNTADKIALIISDQRMPGLTGTEFLAKTLEIQPYTTKILLTGYTDLQALIEGINKCELFQYVNKPWQPAEMIELVEKSVTRYQQTVEKNYFYFQHKQPGS
jgi:response regulator RpfG family c-di-GMP phosphodiesterase